MVFAATLMPFYNAAGAYAPTTQPTLAAATATGQVTPEFTASFGE
jgi:hypothetical protein